MTGFKIQLNCNLRDREITKTIAEKSFLEKKLKAMKNESIYEGVRFS